MGSKKLIRPLDLRSAPLVLLDDSRPLHRAGRSLAFVQPEEVIVAERLDEVPAALAAIDKAYAAGLHVAGWIAYEAAAAFEPRIAAATKTMPDEPLIWMIATKHRISLDSRHVTDALTAARQGPARRNLMRPDTAPHAEEKHRAAVERIQAYIEAGDVYQVNMTFPMHGDLAGDPLALYEKLRRRQPVPYGAYIDTGDIDDEGRRYRVLSLSPELMIARDHDELASRPMKGTAPRGRTLGEDAAIANALARDEKNRAENLMIVDLIRNDMSRIATPGSVTVEDLFSVERYRTLHQMTSTVRATADAHLTPSRLVRALFPCGSVTGAPKIRAQEIIGALETAPRGVYCGAIGHFSHRMDGGPDWMLNVPIRTIVMDTAGHGRFPVGSGIVADSDAKAEFEECLLKARFMETPSLTFDLIETIRWEAGHGYALLPQHLARLAASAAYFDFRFDRDEVIASLDQHSILMTGRGGLHRVRLLLRADGAVSVTSAPFTPAPESIVPTVALSPESVSSKDPFLFHKTTHRSLYNRATSESLAAGHADMLFFNEHDRLTEGAISNVFIVKDGEWITPPVEEGLLPGIFRAAFLDERAAEGRPVTVRPIGRNELFDADSLYIGNALRGLRAVRLAAEKG